MSQTCPITIRAFYRFFTVSNVVALREEVLLLASQWEILGTILIAAEGINGTIAAPLPNLTTFWDELTQMTGLMDLEFKDTFDDASPFRRLKVRLKREIVTMRRPDVDPSQSSGEYIEPNGWNQLLKEEGVVVIDARNSYEVEEGTFMGAIDPHTESFGEFPAWAEQNLDPAVHTKVAMFCTGGIRCEKATALLRNMGFPNVYHLRGGILRYLKEVQPEDSLFQGACFVFDDRRGVDGQLASRSKGNETPDDKP